MPWRPLSSLPACACGQGWGVGTAHSPQGLLPAPQVILQDDAGHRAPLANTRAVANEEAGPLPAGEQDLVLLRDKGQRSGPGRRPRRAVGRRKTRGYLAGVGDGLQLQGGQGPAVGSGQGEGVGNVRRRDTGQSAGLHHAVGVLLPNLGCRGTARDRSGAWSESQGWL